MGIRRRIDLLRWARKPPWFSYFCRFVGSYSKARSPKCVRFVISTFRIIGLFPFMEENWSIWPNIGAISQQPKKLWRITSIWSQLNTVRSTTSKKCKKCKRKSNLSSSTANCKKKKRWTTSNPWVNSSVTPIQLYGGSCSIKTVRIKNIELRSLKSLTGPNWLICSWTCQSLRIYSKIFWLKSSVRSLRCGKATDRTSSSTWGRYRRFSLEIEIGEKRIKMMSYLSISSGLLRLLKLMNTVSQRNLEEKSKSCFRHWTTWLCNTWSSLIMYKSNII